MNVNPGTVAGNLCFSPTTRTLCYEDSAKLCRRRQSTNSTMLRSILQLNVNYYWSEQCANLRFFFHWFKLFLQTIYSFKALKFNWKYWNICLKRHTYKEFVKSLFAINYETLEFWQFYIKIILKTILLYSNI